MSKSTQNELKKHVKNLERAQFKYQKLKKAFRESEEKYLNLTENIVVGIFRSTPGRQGKLLEVNPALVKLLGYKNKEELFVKNVADIYYKPEDRVKFSKKISKNGFVKNEELVYKKKDGTPIIVSETAVAVKDENGEIQYFEGIVEDITERKSAEEALHIQKTYLEELFNSAPEAIVLHDNHDKIVNINDEFTRMFGYSYEEAIGKQINELVASPELIDEAKSLSQKATHGERVEVDSKRKRKDGTLIDVSILGAPIFHNGDQIGVYAIYRDITKRKSAERELHIQKTYFENLFNSAPEAIVLHDNNDRIININEEFTKLFGYSRQEAIGRPINKLVASEDVKEEASLLSQKVINGKRVEMDSKRKRKDGQLIDVSILGAPIFHEARQMGVYAIYRDISEKKKAEVARITLREEARMARDIQKNLLPNTNPELRGYDIAGVNIPALNVGGDYFDFIRLDEHRLALGLGDVSGKGIPAALVMTNLQATIRGQTHFNADPKECLERANKLIYHSTDARTFVSLFYGILNTQKNTLCYTNAGHNMPFLFTTNRKTRPLKCRGIALGIQEQVNYQEEDLPIHPGEILLIYSDGISEAMNNRMEELGDDKLQEIVEANKYDSANELIEKIITAAKMHCGDAAQNDDMTLIVLKRK